MDFESDLCFENCTDNMAASEAPTNTINVSSTSSSSSTTTTTTTNTTTTVTLTTTNNIEHNFQELCRSCGKTNAELYDLFQTTTNSPFSTSSTTCYTHLNNCSFNSSTSAATASSSTTNKLSTLTTTFDSVAATAKATAKGQSNMDNILQEMQIWQLLIKCNDGLPQRICAKCTAQFYMIHKFRRKCLKVQTQLRALYEEQQKFYERQQENEKNVTVKDATIEATSTPPPAASPAAVAVPEPALLVEVVKPPVMHKVNDLVNDNYCEPQQAVVDNTNTKSSVSFEANTGNTNDFIAPSTTATTTLLDIIETMPQKTEANEPTPTSSAPASIDKTFEARKHEHCTVTTGLRLEDKKKPLLKPAVLDAKRSPPLTLQQPSKQICDNDANEKLCLDQQKLSNNSHTTFNSDSKQNDLEQCQKNDEKLSAEHKAQATAANTSSNSSPLSLALTKSNEYLNVRLHDELKWPKDCSSTLAMANSEGSFITKAALKSYTIPPSTSETENRDHQKPITNSEAIELKNANDNNNNAHRNIYSHRYDNRNELNDNICSSTSNSTPPPSSCSSTKRKGTNTNTKTNTNTRRRIIKYANHNRRRPGHCYKSNAKAAATKMARTILSYGSGMAVKRKQGSHQAQAKHKLKRLPETKTSPVSSYKTKKNKKEERRRKKHQQLQKLKMCGKNSSIQMEDEMSSSTVSTTSSASVSASPSSLPSSPAISSTSSHLRATTPAVTDLVRNCAAATSNCANANKNMNKKGTSSADRLSSNESCIMWKTKAAMKANANDMTVEVVVNNAGESTSSNAQKIPFPYTVPATPTGSAPSSPLLRSSLATDTDTDTEIATPTPTPTTTDASSKNPIENQSVTNDNNNLIPTEDEYGSRNKVTMSSSSSSSSSSGNKVKDIKHEGVLLQNTKMPNHNLCPEETADQQQINTNNNNQSDNENTAVATNTQQGSSHDQIENPTQNVELKKDDNQNSSTGTPPAKMGSMKLIIQRKRGERFKCLRKEEDNENNVREDLKPTIPKRKKKSSHHHRKIEMVSFSLLDANCPQLEEISIASKDTAEDESVEQQIVPPFNSEEDENKENPIPIENNYEFDSDSNVSVYRDPLLIRNELLEEDTHVTDFSKTPLSLQTECTKEMYKLYKEKANLESPKKLIVRVPLTSLTQDFKRLHLTMDDQEGETAHGETPDDLTTEETNEEMLYVEVADKQNILFVEQDTSFQANSCSSQSDLLGFSQHTQSSTGTTNSSPLSLQMVRCIEPPICSASSKINDFINDFQNNCIDSSEIEEGCDIIPTLGPRLTQELSDEIRDVEDTLNGILSEMHDKDIYTPRSGETDELFAHSVYSPLTDCPTTPSQSFYAESPCTINSNPMSVSPFIHHNMDYNAMTPQSNHSSTGLCSTYMSGGSSTGPHMSVYSEHYPTYNECFEESTQSELIGFQNDIPCFENIEISNSAHPNEQLSEFKEEDETASTIENNNVNSMGNGCANSNVDLTTSTETFDHIDLTVYKEEADEFAASEPTEVPLDTLAKAPNATADILPQQIPYNTTKYQQLNNPSTFQMQTVPKPLITNTTPAQPHYIVTNTNQPSIIITNPQLNQTRDQIETAFKPHGNNLQFVTLGQSMAANRTQPNHLLNNTNTTKINWPSTVTATPNFNTQPVISTANGTTTYFINANGELYQANIPTTNLQSRPVNTIFVPPNTPQAFSKTNIDNNDKYIPALQQQQRTHHQNNGQYIMLVNNLGTSPQYYATTPANLNHQTVPPPQHTIPTQTVLFQPTQTTQNVPNNVQNSVSYPKIPNNNQNNSESTKSSSHVSISPALEPRKDATATQMLQQKLTQQLQKQRQLQLLQPRSPNVTQKITLVCRFCHKRPKFNNNVDYSNHIINTHPVETPYNCPHCNIHFSRRSDRQLHVAQVHGSRYQCAQCGLSFCAQRTLDFHLQKYHANLGRSHQHLQQNSSSTTTATTPPTTYQLLQHNQQQRLVRVEDVHVQVTGENKNKRSIDLASVGDSSSVSGEVDIKTSPSSGDVEISHINGTEQLQEQQQQAKSRKLCCPDCNDDNDSICGSSENYDQRDINNCPMEAAAAHNSQQNTGNESVNNHSVQHVTIPSPEQAEPDSTTTLRHFRKRQLCEISTQFASASPSSSSSSHHNNGGNDSINLNHCSPDNVLPGDGGGEQIGVERTLLRGSHNCLLCEESFTNEIALRKHHHLAHGVATQSTGCSTAITSMSLVCTICKRSFRMRNALQRHMETHDAEGRPYECNICHVRFPRPSQLTLHKLTVHKFEKPIACEECGKQFGTESTMKAHAAEHEEERTTNALTLEAPKSVSASSSLSASSQSYFSSRPNFDTIKTNAVSLAALATNEQNMNLQTSGEDTATSALTDNNNSSSNNNNNNNEAYNNAAQNAIIVPGLIT